MAVTTQMQFDPLIGWAGSGCSTMKAASACILPDPPQFQRGQRAVFGRFEHHRAAFRIAKVTFRLGQGFAVVQHLEPGKIGQARPRMRRG